MRWIYLVRRSRKCQYVRVIEQCAVPHSHLGQEICCRIGREKVDEFWSQIVCFQILSRKTLVLGESLAGCFKNFGLYPAAEH